MSSGAAAAGLGKRQEDAEPRSSPQNRGYATMGRSRTTSTRSCGRRVQCRARSARCRQPDDRARLEGARVSDRVCRERRCARSAASVRLTVDADGDGSRRRRSRSARSYRNGRGGTPAREARNETAALCGPYSRDRLPRFSPEGWGAGSRPGKPGEVFRNR